VCFRTASLANACSIDVKKDWDAVLVVLLETNAVNLTASIKESPTIWTLFSAIGLKTAASFKAAKGGIGPMDPAEATKIIGETIRPYMGMLLFVRGDGTDPSDVMNNGTISFVDTGSAQLLVTCAHVVTEFRQKRTHTPSLTMAVSGSNQRGVLPISDEWLCGTGIMNYHLTSSSPQFAQNPGRAHNCSVDGTECSNRYFLLANSPAMGTQTRRRLSSNR
jgi:hypothetical protein